MLAQAEGRPRGSLLRKKHGSCLNQDVTGIVYTVYMICMIYILYNKYIYILYDIVTLYIYKHFFKYIYNTVYFVYVNISLPGVWRYILQGVIVETDNNTVDGAKILHHIKP